MPEPITSKQAAKKLGITERQLLQIIYQGKLPSARRIGEIWVVNLEDVERLMPKKSEAAHPATITLTGIPFLDGLSTENKQGLTILGIVLGLTFLFGLMEKYPFYAIFAFISGLIYLYAKYAKDLANIEGWFEKKNEQEEIPPREQWLTLQQVSSILDMPEHEVEAMIEQMQFPSAMMMDEEWIIWAEDLEESGVPVGDIQAQIDLIQKPKIEIKALDIETYERQQKKQKQKEIEAKQYHHAPLEESKGGRNWLLLVIWLVGALACLGAFLTLLWTQVRQ